MTDVEKAIEYFTELRKYFEDKPDETYWGEAHNAVSREMIDSALEALRKKAERPKGCGIIYHHRFLGGYKHVSCPNCGAEVVSSKPDEGNFPYCGGCGKVILDISQPFCGWCGRPLKGGE